MGTGESEDDQGERLDAMIRGTRLTSASVRSTTRQVTDMREDVADMRRQVQALTDYVRSRSSEDSGDMSDPRQRTAATKRVRTRTALMSAAFKLMAEEPDPRMEDIAAEAGVSVATAYNYFHTKDELVQMLYTALFGSSGRVVASDEDVEGLITDYIHDLAWRLNKYHGITVKLLDMAIHDLNIDVQYMWEPLTLMINQGIESGRFTQVNAQDVASHHILALLTSSALFPREPAGNLAHVVLSQLWPVLY
jgi:AcrR family transcriptional regulator